MNDITKIKVDGEPESSYQLYPRNNEFAKRAGGNGGDGSSGVQSDWNQNDATKPDYVKNRPFYTGDPVETVLVEESTVSFADDGGTYIAQFRSTFEATVGDTYKVSWDGAAYECACVNSNQDNILAIGNLSIIGAGSDTGEPFVIGVNNGEGISILTADTSASHTISIGRMVAQVAQMDPKYIHDMYYTEMLEESIEGIEIAGIPTNNEALDPNLPLEIGQIWNVGYETRSGNIYSDAFPNLEVHRAEDGTLYLGVYPDPVGYPFSITATRVRSMSSFVNNSDARSFILTGVSGAIHEEVVHEIPIKYLPNTLLSFKPAGKSYLTFSSLNSFTLKVNDTTKHWDGTLEYFASDKTWSTWDGTTVLSAANNDGEYVLYLRGIGNTKIAGKYNYRWVLTGSDIKCIGNIENLLDYVTVESGEHPAMGEYCYSNMFHQCTSLTQSPALPTTTLANGCYSNMFSGCTSLIQAPALPAMTLIGACYYGMFSGCTSLTKAPVLPSTTLEGNCYSYMFSGCTSLTQAPTLPATTLARSCYDRMFDGCTSLTKAPVLPSTTLEGNCYYGMFSGCTSLIQAPALPAMTLIGACYYGMFSGCTSLTQIPALPATTLSSDCYNGMFSGCTKIKLSSTQSKEYAQEYRIPSSGEGVTATNSLVDMFKSTGGTFTGTPEINTTYYLSVDNMVVRDTEVATLNGYVGSMIDAAEYIIPSSTSGSTKKFKITVDDNGAITATEVT